MKPRSLAKKLTFYYDKDWLTWDPDVMEATLQEKFGDSFDEGQLEKVEATREVIRSDRFAFEPLIFEKCLRAFNGAALSFDVWQPVTEEQLGYGLYVMRQLVGSGPIGDDGMGEQVRGYVATILAQAPIAYAAPHFGFHPAAEPLRRLMKSADLRDGVEKEWTHAMNSDPDTPRQLYRHIKNRFTSRNETVDDLTPAQQAQYRHTVRLATVWEYLYDRDAAPSSNPYSNPAA
jgi:hypothetical protein